MRATGIVRRIDDLGRVVIPKEIRRQMRIKEGDPLEIYTTREGMVCFKKYMPYDDKDWKKIKAIIRVAYPEVEFAIYDSYGDKVAEHMFSNEYHFDDVCLCSSRAVYDEEHDLIAYCKCDERIENIKQIIRECLKTE